MGSSKKVTTGYWYKLLMHFGFCRGPIDAFLEFRGGDRTAWKGVLTESGPISINAPSLWGGETSEGGIVGTFDVRFGDPDQAPSSYLAGALGPQQSAYRGRASGVFQGGRYGAYNPYPKAASFKMRRILKGWDNDEPWYPTKALIPLGIEEVDGAGIPELGDTSGGWRYLQVTNTNPADYSEPDFDDSAWPVGQMPFASLNNHIYTEPSGFPANYNTFWPVNTTMWLRKKISLPGASQIQMQILIDNFATIWVNGHMVLGPESGHDGEPNLALNFFDFNIPGEYLVPGENSIVIKAKDTGLWTYVATRATAILTYRLAAMNPAHIIYDCLTSSDMQGEPIAAVNDASFRAAADRLYDESFGLCTKYDPDSESLEDFRQRICNVIGASCTRSRLDGQWYLDLIRGEHDLESLVVLTDDDVIEFQEDPSTLDDAVNQVVVAWFDPEKKEDRSTSPQHSLGAIAAMGGVRSETVEYPEIPVESLALRCAARDLRNKATPLKRFTLTTNRKPHALRLGQFLRLQLPLRGIADMVCMVGDIDTGVLRSGSIKLVVVQDVFSLPEVTYVVGEPGVDTSPSQEAQPITLQAAFEAPYVELASRLSAADLNAIAPDAGYVGAVAADPATSRNYSLFTRPAGGEFKDCGVGDWCPTAVLDEGIDWTETEVQLQGRRGLDQVAIGSAALIGSEIVRVDALDPVTGAASFGRGCGDTVVQQHAAGARVWFYDAAASVDDLEYLDGESVEVKLLTNTSSQQLDIALATPMTVVVDARQFRPYPPAKIRINGEVLPATIIGDVEVTWQHRDRLLQSDQLVDDSTSSIGPEPGTTYTVRWYLNGTLLQTDSALTGTSATCEPTGGGVLRIEVESVRDGMTSMQMQIREVPVGSPLLTEDDQLINTETDEPILME